jgi:hypothetical protein
MPEQLLESVAIDLCTRSVLLTADDGSEKMVECDTLDEFMNVVEFVRAIVPDDRIVYAEVATTLR